jgi:uncharacterized small protein (DUF1192 family)
VKEYIEKEEQSKESQINQRVEQEQLTLTTEFEEKISLLQLELDETNAANT